MTTSTGTVKMKKTSVFFMAVQKLSSLTSLE